MFKLSEAQFEEMRARDANHFVQAVCAQFIDERPDMLEHPGRAATQRSMHEALDFSMRLGFNSTPHVIRLMYLAADAPDILDDSAVSAYLRRAGATPEQRLDDLLAVVKYKLRGVN